MDKETFFLSHEQFCQSPVVCMSPTDHLGLLQVNGGAGQEPLPIPQDQPGGAGGGTMAEAVQGLGQQVTLSQQVTNRVGIVFVTFSGPVAVLKYYFLLGRDRSAADGKAAESSRSDQRNYPFRFNVQIPRDPSLNSHGLTLTSQTPILVQEVTPGMASSTTRQRCGVWKHVVGYRLLFSALLLLANPSQHPVLRPDVCQC